MKAKASPRVLSTALTWDGARWPLVSLPAKARAFLKGKGPASRTKLPSVAETTRLFANGQIDEIRICWVPRLRGGDAVLTEPFLTPGGLRLAFTLAKTVSFGEILGVVYRRSG